VVKPTDEPDLAVYRVDGGRFAYLCRHCAAARAYDCADEASAVRHAQLHAWSVHSLRRVWIAWDDPRHARAVQIALPIVIAHNTTRHG